MKTCGARNQFLWYSYFNSSSNKVIKYVEITHQPESFYKCLTLIRNPSTIIIIGSLCELGYDATNKCT